MGSLIDTVVFSPTTREDQFPFVRADVKCFFDNEHGNQEFRDELCRWGSGAHVSFISGELPAQESP